MFLELIAVIFAGLAGAGVMMFVNKLTGHRLPSWLVPVVAGLAMIGTTVASEYSWFGRTSATLPEQMRIVQTVESRALYRPWTYVVPFVNRFAAIDISTVAQNTNHPGQLMIEMYFFGRWSPVSRLPVLVDCIGMRRASLADGAEFSDTGAISDAAWLDVGSGDPIVATACMM